MSSRLAPANVATVHMSLEPCRAQESARVYGATAPELLRACHKAIATYARKQGVGEIAVRYATVFETVAVPPPAERQRVATLLHAFSL